jgi:hypothetical protein
MRPKPRIGVLVVAPCGLLVTDVVALNSADIRSPGATTTTSGYPGDRGFLNHIDAVPIR